MKPVFQKTMRRQLQSTLDHLSAIETKALPKNGWIKVIRQALGMSTYQLAKRMKCSQANITALERREKKGRVSLELLAQVAKALNCHCVYFFVPNKPLDQLLDDQARRVAQKHLKTTGHSMTLEKQGLSPRQKKQAEQELIQELLSNNTKQLWNDDREI